MHCSTSRVADSVHPGDWTQPPRWVEALLEPCDHTVLKTAVEGITGMARSNISHNWRCVSVRIADAGDLSPLDLQHAIVLAYRTIRSGLGEMAKHPVRFWNFIPGINNRIDEQTDQYMVFNAGRHAAYLEWYACDDMPGDIATASGVGHRGNDLFVHCLACQTPGLAVENPRQIPAYRYSQRYGPFPPSFTRATIVPSFGGVGDSLYIGGTASICGENSLHCSNLQKQTQETLSNLAAVIKAAASRRHGGIGEICVNGDMRFWLSLLRDVRVYYTIEEQVDELKRLLKNSFNEARYVEWVPANLCRPELLVEIEAVAELPRVIATNTHLATTGSST